MKTLSLLKLVFLVALLCFLSACGSSSGPGTKVLAVRLKTQSTTYSGTISAAHAVLTLPAGATVRTTSSGELATGVAVPSGLAVNNSLVAGAVSSGIVNVALVSSAAAGFGLGEFVTLYVDLPPDSTLTAADFNPVTNVQTRNISGAIDGITMSAF